LKIKRNIKIQHQRIPRGLKEFKLKKMMKIRKGSQRQRKNWTRKERKNSNKEKSLRKDICKELKKVSLS